MSLRIYFIAIFLLLLIAGRSYAAFPIQAENATLSVSQNLSSEVHAPATIKSSSSSSKQYRDNAIGLSIAAFCCGIAGLFIAGILFGAAAIVMGVIGMNKSLRGLALAGIILGVIDIIGALIVISQM